MAQFFQITANEILSGVSKSIYDVYGDSLAIYKDKQQYLDLPAVTLYCINYEKEKGRFDRFTNTFNIIINYFPKHNVIINDNRIQMSQNVEKIMDAVEYINLPAYQLDNKGEFIPGTLPTRAHDINIEEKEGFMQISVSYTVRTRKFNQNTKMNEIHLDINNNIN